MYKIIIAIDGFSSCGKSTTAKKVSAILGYTYVDTGAMYRAVTLYFIRNNVSVDHKSEVEKALSDIQISFRRNPETSVNETILNDVNVESDIRKMSVSERVSQVSAIHEVRKAMVAQQQLMGGARGLVMDGRDIGTTVFPDAELKIFMTAEPSVRARRRQVELRAQGENVPLEVILENLKNRDLMDTTRLESPLVKAVDAILLDNTYLTFEEQVDLITEWADERILLLTRRHGLQLKA